MNFQKATFNLPQYTHRRRALRKSMTEPEKRFWHIVRAKQPGVRFRRQHSIGCYIVDFYCHAWKLAIEIDGESHFQPEAIQYDRKRDDFLRSLEIRVTRFTNREIMENPEGVWQKLLMEFVNSDS